jgi:hypothetical protein
VILIGHVPLETLTAERLLGLMGGAADMALIWRDGYFFDGPDTGRDAKPAQAPNPIKRNSGLNSALSL